MRDIARPIDPLDCVDPTEKASICCSTLLMNNIASCPKNSYASSWYFYSNFFVRRR